MNDDFLYDCDQTAISLADIFHAQALRPHELVPSLKTFQRLIDQLFPLMEFRCRTLYPDAAEGDPEPLDNMIADRVVGLLFPEDRAWEDRVFSKLAEVALTRPRLAHAIRLVGSQANDPSRAMTDVQREQAARLAGHLAPRRSGKRALLLD